LSMILPLSSRSCPLVGTPRTSQELSPGPEQCGRARHRGDEQQSIKYLLAQAASDKAAAAACTGQMMQQDTVTSLAWSVEPTRARDREHRGCEEEGAVGPRHLHVEIADHAHGDPRNPSDTALYLGQRHVRVQNVDRLRTGGWFTARWRPRSACCARTALRRAAPPGKSTDAPQVRSRASPA
jgi:hypothetical protein